MTSSEPAKLKNRHVLEGIKIVDFSWAAAIPLATKYLANHGATVVKIESLTKADLCRSNFPFADGIPGINRSATFAQYNDSKYSMRLDINHPIAPEVVKKLIAWSNVVTENFRPQTMEKWSLGYEELVKIKPDIIMLRASMQGQTGPYAQHVGLGTMLGGIVGFVHHVGWPDRAPSGAFSPWTDYISALYATSALIAAIDYWRRTGRGQCIEMSQAEAALSLSSPAILDYTINKRVHNAIGNRCPYAAPHGVYRCKGDERWCAIAVFSDDEWRAFCRVIGKPEWIRDTKFASLMSRKKNENELDVLIEKWTTSRSAEEVMHIMQETGISAGVVLNGRDMREDPQFNYRHYFWELEHPEMGLTAYDGTAFKLNQTPSEIRMPAPCLGEHTEYVCCHLLGMTDKEFTELFDAGVFN